MRGFSLIEIVIGLVVLSVLGIMGANMISGSVVTNQVISNEQLAYSNARYALDRMSREIREIKYDISTGAIGIANPVSNMTASKLEFTQSTLSSSRLVTLTYTAPNAGIPGSISMAYNGSTPPSVLINNLSNDPSTGNVVFSYLDINGNTTTDVNSLRHVRIDLSVKPDSTKNQVLSLSTIVSLRNK